MFMQIRLLNLLPASPQFLLHFHHYISILHYRILPLLKQKFTLGLIKHRAITVLHAFFMLALDEDGLLAYHYTYFLPGVGAVVARWIGSCMDRRGDLGPVDYR
jgi:hypothetical protein